MDTSSREATHEGPRSCGDLPEHTRARQDATYHACCQKRGAAFLVRSHTPDMPSVELDSNWWNSRGKDGSPRGAAQTARPCGA